jgi:hypothetical protein
LLEGSQKGDEPVELCAGIVSLLTISLKFRVPLVFQLLRNVAPCPFPVLAFPVLVLRIELLVAIHLVAQVSCILVSLIVGTTFLWTCVAINISPDRRNNLSELLADPCI